MNAFEFVLVPLSLICGFAISEVIKSWGIRFAPDIAFAPIRSRSRSQHSSSSRRCCTFGPSGCFAT